MVGICSKQHKKTSANIVFAKNGLKVNFQPIFFRPQNCFYENFCINQFHKMSNLLERTKLNFVQILPRSSQIQDSLYKIAHFYCVFYHLFPPKLNSISHDFQTSDSVIFRTLFLKIKVKFSEFTFHLFIKLQENLFQVWKLFKLRFLSFS